MCKNKYAKKEYLFFFNIYIYFKTIMKFFTTIILKKFILRGA